MESESHFPSLRTFLQMLAAGLLVDGTAELGECGSAEWMRIAGRGGWGMARPVPDRLFERLVPSELGDRLLGAVVVDDGLGGAGSSDERAGGGVVECAWEAEAGLM